VEGMKQGWMGHKWDITELFLCGNCGKIFASRKASQKHIRRKHLARWEFINAISFFSQCIFCGKKLGRNARKVSGLEYDSIAGL
jgi:hypothetical protein